MMTLAWTEKYRPKTLREIAGQPAAVEAMTRWAKGWERGKPDKPALLLYGPPGTGKTSAALALARDMHWDCIELNASDERTYRAIKTIAERARMGSVLGGRKMILLDEADNVYGVERGGYRAILELLQTFSTPVVLTATNNRDIPDSVRRMCREVSFTKVRATTVQKVLSKICEAEKIRLPAETLKLIAERCKGDLRAAINDLQATCALPESRAHVSMRVSEINIFQVLGALLKARSASEARSLLFNLDMPPDEALSWICENIPRMLREVDDLARVYDHLAQADLYRARILRRQAYRLMKYLVDFMTAGVSLSRRGDFSYVKFQFPSIGILMSRTREVRNLRDSVALKVAKYCHTSSRIATKHFLPYLRYIVRSSPSVVEKLQLTPDELSFLGVNENS